MRGLYLIILLSITSLTTSAQAVKKAEMEFYGIETAESATFNVSITYYFTEPLKSAVELKALNFGTSVANSIYFRKDAQGGVQRIDFKGKPRLTTGEIPQLFTPRLGNKLTVFYSMPLPDMNDDFQMRIPVVYPNIPTESNNAGLFTASIELPETVNLYEQFPAQTWSEESTSPTTVHKLSLQAVPSVITIRGGTAPKPLFSTMHLVDGFIILLLTVMLFLGWKKIKQI